MVKTVTAIKARQNLGRLLDEVYYKGDQFVIERAGRSMAAVVPVGLLEEQQARRERLFAIIDEIRRKNRHLKTETIEREVAAAVRAVRRKAARERS
ncbi:MAG: hypothetical protein ACRD96_17775 [Bryobacteraceae bacterium]